MAILLARSGDQLQFLADEPGVPHLDDADGRRRGDSTDAGRDEPRPHQNRCDPTWH